MTTDEHISNIGKLLVNLQSLEAVLRFCLAKKAGTKMKGLTESELSACPIGTTFAESQITDYASLRELIDRFNEIMVREGKAPLGKDLIATRDAIAHGRIIQQTKAFPLRLIKFDKPDKAMNVRLTFNQILSDAWFKAQITFAFEAINRVMSEAQP